MSTNLALFHALSAEGLLSNSPFHSTVFGSEAILVGVDVNDKIVFRQKLTKPTAMTLGQHSTLNLPVHDFDATGHPRTAAPQMGINLRKTNFFQFNMTNEVTSTDRQVKDDTDQTVVGWYLIGTDPGSPVDGLKRYYPVPTQVSNNGTNIRTNDIVTGDDPLSLPEGACEARYRVQLLSDAGNTKYGHLHLLLVDQNGRYLTNVSHASTNFVNEHSMVDLAHYDDRGPLIRFFSPGMAEYTNTSPNDVELRVTRDGDNRITCSVYVGDVLVGTGGDLIYDKPFWVQFWIGQDHHELYNATAEATFDISQLQVTSGTRKPMTRLGLGAPLDATALSALDADGRMWIKWSCQPTVVGLNTALPVLFTDKVSGEYRKTDRVVTAVGVNKTTGKAVAHVKQSTPLLHFDADALFSSATDDDLASTTTALGQRIAEYGKALLDARHGVDAVPVSPLTSLPTDLTTLLDLTDPAINPARHSTATLTGLVAGMSQPSIVTNALYAPSAYAHSTGSFIWPTDGAGLKLTVDPASLGYGSNNSWLFELVKKAADTFAEPSTLILRKSKSHPSYVGTYNGDRNPLSTDSGLASKMVLDRAIGHPVETFEEQLYEIYIFPDHRAFIYATGRYVGEIRLSAHTVTPGAEYTLGAGVYYEQVGFHTAKVERFTVPGDYVPVNDPDPVITGIDATNTAWSTKYTSAPSLQDGNLYVAADSNGVRLYSGAGNTFIEFTVTDPARLSLHTAPTQRGSFRLESLSDPDNFATFDTGRTAHRDWYTFPMEIPAGRYQLKALDAGADAYLTELKVEHPVRMAPSIVDVSADHTEWSTREYAAEYLLNGNLSYSTANGVYLYKSSNKNNYVVFTLTKAAKFSFYPHTYTDDVKLVRIDAPGIALDLTGLVSDQWYTCPYQLPAGRYQLIGSGRTALMQWKVEDPGALPTVPAPVAAPDFRYTDFRTYLAAGDEALNRLTNGVTQDFSSTACVRFYQASRGVEFDVTEESLLSVHTSNVVSWLRLRRVDISGMDYNSPILRDREWYTFPESLPVGRYHLYTDYDCYLNEWFLTPAVNEQPVGPAEIYHVDATQTGWTSNNIAQAMLSNGDATTYSSTNGVLILRSNGHSMTFKVSKDTALSLASPHKAYAAPVRLHSLDADNPLDVTTAAFTEGQWLDLGVKVPAGAYRIESKADTVLSELKLVDAGNFPAFTAFDPQLTLTTLDTSLWTSDPTVAGPKLVDGNLTGAENGAYLSPAAANLTFTLAQEASLSLYVDSAEKVFKIERTDLPGLVFQTRDDAFTGGWYVMPFNLPAGTYKITTLNETLIREWVAGWPLTEVTTTPPPSITDIDASKSNWFTGNEYKALTDGTLTHTSTSSSTNLWNSSPETDRIEFTLPVDAKFSLYVSGGWTDPVQLVRIDEVGLDITTPVLVNDAWYTFPSTLPAGRYRLIGQGNTVFTEWKAEVPVS